AAPRRRPEIGPQPLDSVDLDDALPLEVVTRVQPEILMGRAGEAVVTHDAVGDEVAGAGRDVEHRHLDTEVLDRDHSSRSAGLHGGSVNRALAGGRGIDEMEE